MSNQSTEFVEIFVNVEESNLGSNDILFSTSYISHNTEDEKFQFFTKKSEIQHIFQKQLNSYLSKLNTIYIDKIFTGLDNQSIYKTSYLKVEDQNEEEIRCLLSSYRKKLFYSDQDSVREGFEILYHKNPDIAKQLIERLFFDLLRADVFEEKAIINLFKIMGNFEYEEMCPIGLIILSGALNLKSDKIKSVVLDILGHWDNKEIYNLIKKLEPPISYLYKLKFESLLQSFEEKYAISKKN